MNQKTISQLFEDAVNHLNEAEAMATVACQPHIQAARDSLVEALAEIREQVGVLSSAVMEVPRVLQDVAVGKFERAKTRMESIDFLLDQADLAFWGAKARAKICQIELDARASQG